MKINNRLNKILSSRYLNAKVKYTYNYFDGKTYVKREENGIIESLLIDTITGVYGVSVKFPNKLINFILNTENTKNLIGEDLENLEIIQ